MKEAGLVWAAEPPGWTEASPRSPAAAPGWRRTPAAGPAPAPGSSPGETSPVLQPAAGLQDGDSGRTKRPKNNNKRQHGSSSVSQQKYINYKYIKNIYVIGL